MTIDELKRLSKKKRYKPSISDLISLQDMAIHDGANAMALHLQNLIDEKSQHSKDKVKGDDKHYGK
jgi:hypothetical protein